MKKSTMKVIALLLAAVMAVTPASTSYAAQDTGATEATVEASSEAADIISDTMDDAASTEESEQTDVVESVENIEQPDATDETESTEETEATDGTESSKDSEKSEDVENADKDEVAADMENGEEVPENSVSDNAAEEGTKEDSTISENTVSDNTVSENTVSENETDALFPGMPESYTLTSVQKAEKEELSRYVGEIGSMTAGEHYAEGQLVYSTDSEEEAQMVAEAYGGELQSCFDGVAVIKLSGKVTVKMALYAAADMTMTLPAVWPNYYRYPHGEKIAAFSPEEMTAQPASYGVNDPFLDVLQASYQWQHYAVGSMYAWNAGYRGKGVKVAVIDSGVAASHEDIKVAASYNAVNPSLPAAADTSDHGTHVAGIIGATGNNGKGGSGIAPEAEIYNIKVFVDGEAESGMSSTIARAIAHAVEVDKVDIINMSLGGIGSAADNEIEAKAVEKAVDAGVAVFVSAGNDGSKVKCYPAAFPKSICVAATDKSNGRASFSNYGAWVDLAAPGVDIPSTFRNNGYGYMSGTSQASPVAAGTAAVILSADPTELRGKTGAAKVAALEKLMKANVTKASGGSIGAGITYLPKALKVSGVAAKPAKPVFSIPQGTITDKEVTTAISTTIDCDLYYSVDGKTPAMKNGVVINAVKASSNPQNVTVNGIVNGKVTGKATVKAMAVNKYTQMAGPVATVTYTFKPKVESVTITGATTKVPAGKTLTLKAAVTPEYAANKAVTWTISADAKTSGVSITTAGAVKTTKEAVQGTYTVTATPKDGLGGTPGTYTVTVTGADALVKTVKFTQTKVSLKIKNANDAFFDMSTILEAAKADGTPAMAADFIWSSSKPAVATVDSATGVVTAVGAGTTVITALAADGGGVKKTCTVAVEQLATGIQITQPIDKTNYDTVHLAAGKSAALKANVLPATTKNKAVLWSINADEASKVSITTSGVVKAAKDATAGDYVVTVQAKDDNTVVKTINVKVYKGAATAVTLDKKTATLFRTANRFGGRTTATLQVAMAGTDGYYQDYIVTSSNENIVTVAKAGNSITVTATGNATGTSTVKVLMLDGSGKNATCKVTVQNPVTNLYIAPEAGRTGDIGKGKTLKLSAIYEEEFGKATKKAEWTVLSGEEFVKVDKNGKVTALQGIDESDPNNLKPGKAVIRATATDRSGAYAEYTVYTYEAIQGILVPWNENGTFTIYYKSDWTNGKYLPWNQAGVSPEFACELGNVEDTGILTASNGRRLAGQFILAVYRDCKASYTIKTMDGSNKKYSYSTNVELRRP